MLWDMTDVDPIKMLPPRYQLLHKPIGVYALDEYLHNRRANRRILQRKLWRWYRMTLGRTADLGTEANRVRWRGHRRIHQRTRRPQFPGHGRDHFLVQSRAQHRPRERAELEDHPGARSGRHCAGDRTSAWKEPAVLSGRNLCHSFSFQTKAKMLLLPSKLS